jgi:hypothetical protein
MLHTTAQDLSEKKKERERERKRERERETLFLHRPSGLQDITHYKCLIFMILWFGGVQGSNMCSFILISIMLKKVLTQGNPNTGACAWENSRCESERERERAIECIGFTLCEFYSQLCAIGISLSTGRRFEIEHAEPTS